MNRKINSFPSAAPQDLYQRHLKKGLYGAGIFGEGKAEDEVAIFR